MLSRVSSSALEGIVAHPVEVEVSITSGLPSFSVVGLPHSSVREGRERIVAALKHSGWPLQPRRVTVNLAPADLRKGGSAFDVPVAVGILTAAGVVSPESTAGCAFVGELGLDGALRPVRGALALVAAARDAGASTVFVPHDNAPEAGLVDRVGIRAARSLRQIVAHLTGTGEVPTVVPPHGATSAAVGGPDLIEVRGQAVAKRALEIAAAGGHNVLLVGPPGTGKTLLARRLPGILPPPTPSEFLEIVRVHSAAGRIPHGALPPRKRPFRAPHHSVSHAGLVGGGAPVRTGEVSLAHRGVLFLDELPEFRRAAVESLRQPLEDGVVTIARANAHLTFPARFVLVAAMNPCPCGHRGDGSERCVCDDARVARYRSRVSGPVLDRIDLHVPVAPVSIDDLRRPPSGPRSADIRHRVVEARARQRERLGAEASCNAEMGPGPLRRHAKVRPGVARLLQNAIDRMGLSARGYHRILKVSRTIADLDGSDAIGEEHAAEAVQYRALDRNAGGGG